MFQPDWVKILDRKKMEYYYCNQFTNATREDEPAEYEEPPSKAILKMFVSNPLLRAALVIQEAWFERAERHVKMIAEARKNARNATNHE